MSVFGAAKERVKATVPGLTTKAEKQRQAMERIAESQGVSVGQFRCEECGIEGAIESRHFGGPLLIKTPDGNLTTLIVCQKCYNEAPEIKEVGSE
jgi:hypothetical protein